MSHWQLRGSGFTSAMLYLVIAIGCQAMVGSSIPDGPLPEPKQDLAFPEGTEVATVVVAGGCFWCMEAVFEEIEGVNEVVSGFAGGTAQTANYQDVARGRSDHAEAIRISFDPDKVSFAKIMQIFFTMHNPLQLNGQTPDIGKQYRSAVFYANNDERQMVAAYIKQLDASGSLDKPVVTTLEPLDNFYAAEDDHQDYVKLNPGDRYVVKWALPKLAKVKKLFPDAVRAKVKSESNPSSGDR